MIFRGDIAHCPLLGALEVLFDHVLEVNDTGFISYIAPAHLPGSKVLLERSNVTHIPRGSFLLPTFCDLHLHAPQFLYQGTGLHLPLMQWLDEYAFRAEERLDADIVLAEKVYTRLAERLKENGTGAVLLLGTIKSETNLILARVMQEAGIRAFVGKLSMDKSSRPTYMEQSAQHSLSAARNFADQCQAITADLPPERRLVEPVLTPRFVPTCSDELLTGLGELSAQRELRVQSHMAEAHDQVAWVRQERNADDMEVFARSGLLTPRTVQAHCTFLGPSSLAGLAGHGSAIAHCPLSNAYFSAQPFRLREALCAGVRVGLGTDIAGGYDIDMMKSMRMAVAVSRMREGTRIMEREENSNASVSADHSAENEKVSINWKEALYLATRGGAFALNLSEGSGVFLVGAPFDAQIIRVLDDRTGEGIGPLDSFEGGSVETTLNEEVIEKWWCLGDVRNRSGVWIQGRKIWG